MVKEPEKDSFSSYGLPKTYKEDYFFVCAKCRSEGKLYAYIMIKRRIYRYCGKWEITHSPVMKERVIYT